MTHTQRRSYGGQLSENPSRTGALAGAGRGRAVRPHRRLSGGPMRPHVLNLIGAVAVLLMVGGLGYGAVFMAVGVAVHRPHIRLLAGLLMGSALLAGVVLHWVERKLEWRLYSTTGVHRVSR